VKKSLEEILNYQFHQPSLLIEALTHASAKGKKCDNERLEFLGDRVLGLVIAKTLYHRFPEEREGELAAKQAHLVSREVLGQVAEKLKLDEMLKVAYRDRAAGVFKNKALIANACEALIAALFLDGGLEVAERFILHYWAEALNASETLERDAKSLLQEWAQGLKKPAPTYILIRQTGPDHDPLFEIGVQVKGLEMVTGKGYSKREAEQNAAKVLFNQIRGHNA
jgi:ribonuclease III